MKILYPLKKFASFFRPFLFFNVFSIPLAKRISNVERNVEDTTTMVFRAVHRGERGGKRVVVSTFGKREVKNFQLRATLSLPVKISSHVSPRFFLLFFFLALYFSFITDHIFFPMAREKEKWRRNKKSEFSLFLSLSPSRICLYYLTSKRMCLLRT